MIEDVLPAESAHTDTGYQELELVVYIGDLRVVGNAHFGVGHRASSRRPSDFIRAFADERLTLSSVRVYSKASNELIDTSPFSIINLSRVDMMYARELGEEEPQP
jgi:hypothetical protein